jgi:hypothetical protein
MRWNAGYPQILEVSGNRSRAKAERELLASNLDPLFADAQARHQSQTFLTLWCDIQT